MKVSAKNQLKKTGYIMAIVGVLMGMGLFIVPQFSDYIIFGGAGFLIAFGFGTIYKINQFE